MFQNNQRQKTLYNETCGEEKSQQDPPGLEKGNVIWNYRPIAYLNLSWKLLIGIIAEEIYDHLKFYCDLD